MIENQKKLALIHALVGEAINEADDEQAQMAVLMPKHDTEEAALRYARRLASLRPGDAVKIIGDDKKSLQNAIFVGNFACGKSYATVALAYNSEFKMLGTAVTNLHGVVLD